MTDQPSGTTTRTRRTSAKDKAAAEAVAVAQADEAAAELPADCIPIYRHDGTTVGLVPRDLLFTSTAEVVPGMLMVPTPQATVHQLMGRVLADLPAIGKNQRNTQQNFNFRGIDDVLNALNPLLAKYGVYYVPSVLERVAATRTTGKGGVMYEVNLHVRFTFYGPLGDYVTGSAWGEGTDMGDKATNKAMTQAMKAMLFQAFAVSTEEQSASDPDLTTPEETVDPDVQAREAGWPDRATAAKAHEELAARVRARTEEGLITADNAKALKEMGFGWPMTKADFVTYEEQCKELVTLNRELKEAAAKAETANDQGADAGASEVGE